MEEITKDKAHINYKENKIMFESKLPPENKQDKTSEETYTYEQESLSVGMDVYVEDVNGSKVFHLAKITSINVDANTASCFVYDQITNVVKPLDSIFLVDIDN